ncbi:hypothetical protein CLU79DRAFT_756802 [Phycomyces nitens]|nr:hypothetical protein CLU79DRAFT_756802 [Phycomyces nitens]
MAYEWVYASGAVWVPFDLQSQSNIEGVWKRAEATWIYVGSFRDKAYINGPELYVHYLGNDLPIARRCL